jgi:hypothetical protein
MTSRSISDAIALFNGAVDPAVALAQAAVDLAPPGAVQSAINFTALGSASLKLLQVAGDAGNVFAQNFHAAILEIPGATSLATAIVGDIEQAIALREASAPKGLAAAATIDTVSCVLLQVQQQAAANETLATTVFQSAKAQPGGNFPATYEAQLLGGQIFFQQDIDTVINSFPSSVSDENESNVILIATLQNLLRLEQDLSNTLSQIDTNNNLEQPIALTGLNVAVVLDDARILTDLSIAATAYAAFAQA